MLPDGRGSSSFECALGTETALAIGNGIRLRSGPSAVGGKEYHESSRVERAEHPIAAAGSDVPTQASQARYQLDAKVLDSQAESSTICVQDAARPSFVGFLTYTFWKPLSLEDGVPLSAVVSLWLFIVFYVFGCLALFCNECQYLLSVLGYFGACLTSFIGYLTLVYEERTKWFKDRHIALGRLCQRVTSLVFVNAFALLFSYFLGLPNKPAGEEWRETLKRGWVWNMAVVHVCGHLLVSSVGYLWETRGEARDLFVLTSEKGNSAVMPVPA